MLGEVERFELLSHAHGVPSAKKQNLYWIADTADVPSKSLVNS